jgi:hypothetical protein
MTFGEQQAQQRRILPEFRKNLAVLNQLKFRALIAKPRAERTDGPWQLAI